MLTSKQRSILKAKASKIDAIMQIGKNGKTDNLVKSLDSALEARELIKVTVLNNCSDSPSELVNEIAAELNAEVVCAIGKKIILYRISKREDVEHIDINN